MELKFTKEVIIKIKDEANLIVFNSKLCSIKNMQTINKIVEGLKDVKITIPNN